MTSFPSTLHRFATHFSNEEAVYGVILVSGLVAVAGSAEISAVRALVLCVMTVIVFWAAHVYAGTVARHGAHVAAATGEMEVVGLRRAIRASIDHANGLLVSAVLPVLVLVAGAAGLLDDQVALWATLWVNVGVLLLLGWVAYERKGAPVRMRLLGGVATASFGLLIIVVKAIVTH